MSLRLGSKGIGLDCKVVLTGVAPQPIIVPDTKPLLEGMTLAQELLDQVAEKATHAGNPVANVSGSTPAYRRRMAGILTRRALLTIVKNLGMIQ